MYGKRTEVVCFMRRRIGNTETLGGRMWRNRGQKNNIRGNCWDEEKMKEWLTKLERKKECMRVGGGERKSE